MKLRWVNNCGSSRAIILFAGWGMDENPFAQYSFAGYDFGVVFDYSDGADSHSAATELDCYDEICIFAWSFGVAMAQRFINEHPELPLTLRVAVNGTPRPVDNDRGIPVAIFQGTLGGFSDSTLQKFRRRMCGSRSATESFLTCAPRRSLESLRDELLLMAETDASTLPVWWDQIYISDNDMIFPAASQQRAWASHHAVRHLAEEYHLPDLAGIIRRSLLDKAVVAQRFSAAATSYDENALIQREMIDNLIGRLPEKHFRDLLEVGVGTGLLTRAVEQRLTFDNRILWDLTAQYPGVTECDAETAIRKCAAESYDLIVSASAIQWFHSPATFVMECCRVLRPGGILAIATYAPGTFVELDAFGVKGLDYLSVEAWRDIFSRGRWDAYTIDEQVRRLSFATPLQLFRHIKLTGVNAIGGGAGNAATLMRMLERYPLSSDGQASLTYRPLFLLARKSYPEPKSGVASNVDRSNCESI